VSINQESRMPLPALRRRLALALFPWMLLGSVPALAETTLITGTATYRERIALPPQAVFEASVEDVSRADAPSIRIAEVHVDAPRVPVRFEIPVDADRIEPRHRYVVRARILVDGKPMFTSDTAHPVLDAAGTRHVDILLRRVATPPAAASNSAPRRLSGLYRYQADAALFTDCKNGRSIAVADAGDHAALQRAYLAAQPAPGANMLVTVDAHLRREASVDAGGRPQRVLVVDRFIALGAGTCETPPATSSLQDTYWKLQQLRGQPVTVSEQAREPHLVLSSASARVTGSTGCNRLAGNYALDGDALSFSRSAGTMRACLEGMAQERDFLDALAATRKWRIDAGRLELVDAQGELLARFQAVWLR
jgi:uncharacterized lipoprotein YbaY/heat shock protein HslJ